MGSCLSSPTGSGSLHGAVGPTHGAGPNPLGRAYSSVASESTLRGNDRPDDSHAPPLPPAVVSPLRIRNSALLEEPSFIPAAQSSPSTGSSKAKSLRSDAASVKSSAHVLPPRPPNGSIVSSLVRESSHVHRLPAFGEVEVDGKVLGHRQVSATFAELLQHDVGPASAERHLPSTSDRDLRREKDRTEVSVAHDDDDVLSSAVFQRPQDALVEWAEVQDDEMSPLGPRAFPDGHYSGLASSIPPRAPHTSQTKRPGSHVLLDGRGHRQPRSGSLSLSHQSLSALHTHHVTSGLRTTPRSTSSRFSFVTFDELQQKLAHSGRFASDKERSPGRSVKIHPSPAEPPAVDAMPSPLDTPALQSRVSYRRVGTAHQGHAQAQAHQVQPLLPLPFPNAGALPSSAVRSAHLLGFHARPLSASLLAQLPDGDTSLAADDRCRNWADDLEWGDDMQIGDASA